MPVALLAALVLAQNAAPTYVPAETRVLVVPPLNTSGDKYEEMKKNQADAARKTIQGCLEECGFQLVPEEEAATVVKASGLDLTDEENQRKDNLYRLADTAKARLVIFTVITATGQKTTRQILMDRLEGYASLKTWLLDAQTKTAILSAAKTEGKSSRNGPTGSLRQIRAVRLGLDEQLKDFLKPYPIVKK